MTRWLTVSLIVVLVGHTKAVEPTRPKTPPTAEELRASIDALKAERVAWRQIAWKSCLLEGLKESRDKKKPLLLWIFIDRPVDDARC